jgi:cytochrome c556
MMRLARFTQILITCGLVGAYAFALRAAEKPPEDYVKAMKDLDQVTQALDKYVKAEDYDALTALAARATNDFTVAIMYWRGKATDANNWADDGQKAASDLAVTSYAMNQEGVAFAAQSIKDVCAPCHAAHREKMDDGSFQIK